jgi:hypothetical protein
MIVNLNSSRSVVLWFRLFPLLHEKKVNNMSIKFNEGGFISVIEPVCTIRPNG